VRAKENACHIVVVICNVKKCVMYWTDVLDADEIVRRLE